MIKRISLKNYQPKKIKKNHLEYIGKNIVINHDDYKIFTAVKDIKVYKTETYLVCSDCIFVDEDLSVDVENTANILLCPDSTSVIDKAPFEVAMEYIQSEIQKQLSHV